jgi:hypothetical protein
VTFVLYESYWITKKKSIFFVLCVHLGSRASLCLSPVYVLCFGFRSCAAPASVLDSRTGSRVSFPIGSSSAKDFLCSGRALSSAPGPISHPCSRFFFPTSIFKLFLFLLQGCSSILLLVKKSYRVASKSVFFSLCLAQIRFSFVFCWRRALSRFSQHSVDPRFSRREQKSAVGIVFHSRAAIGCSLAAVGSRAFVSSVPVWSSSCAKQAAVKHSLPQV